MEDFEIEYTLQNLVKNNIPFVVFREPGKEANVVIQNSPLTLYPDLIIKEKGFYVFPFSKNEKIDPLLFSPDEIFPWKDIGFINKEYNTLPIPEVPYQNLFQVDKEEYLNDIDNFILAFDKRNIKKAIYSRIKTEFLSPDFNISQFFDRLLNEYPRAFVYMMNIPGDGIWMGASPELLLSFNKGTAKTVALAGTLKKNSNLPSPQWTRKEIDEHRLVEKHIINVCKELGVPFKKSSVRSTSTGKVYHLKSDFDLNLMGTDTSKFLDRLHPTPAISGLPQDKALELIYQVEKHDRSLYCGFLGFVEDKSKFDLFINLRCMKIVDNSYSLFAGGGITPNSDPETEWEETIIKMSTLVDIMPSSLSLTSDNH